VTITNPEQAAAGGATLPSLRRFVASALPRDPVVLAIVAVFAALIVFVPPQAIDSAAFTGAALTGMAPWLALSVLIAAAAKATGADALVAHAFSGRERRAIVVAALFGALSPFCSCGVIPLVAGLLGAGVPLAPVMAFWLASPIMDPEMFVLTAAGLGIEFAVAKALAAIGIGLIGGFATAAITRTNLLGAALRNAPLSACAAKKALKPAPAMWRFWEDGERSRRFVVQSGQTGWFLLRWLALAFLIESLMVRWIPAELVATWLGGDGFAAVPLAVALGVPAYLNGYAAIPLVSGFVDLGMNPAVGIAFMVSGGVTSIPAAMAVWALARPRVFALYLVLAAIGATAAGFGYAGFLAAA
jgi:hypothetical protein